MVYRNRKQKGVQEGPRNVRTIVFSDIHGEPDIIRGVLEHSDYSSGEDRLVFTGDAVDIGRDSAGSLALLDKLGAELLVGNHEYGVFVDWDFEPLDSDVVESVKRRLASGDWLLAAEADGVLITHAGVSARWTSEFEDRAGGDVARFVSALNREFADAIESGLLATQGVVDAQGPLWWRPDRGVSELPGIVQVCGHTPVELLAHGAATDSLSKRGLHLVDPWVRGWSDRGFAPPTPVRYAVIEDGTVRVVDAG